MSSDRDGRQLKQHLCSNRWSMDPPLWLASDRGGRQGGVVWEGRGVAHEVGGRGKMQHRGRPVLVAGAEGAGGMGDEEPVP